MMQLDMFMDERIKILYALSFMHGGIVQVWAKNETNVVPSHSSTLSTLAELLAGIKRTFGDPKQERTAYTQLHTLKMMMGMTADEYTAKFEMLVGRTGFNKAGGHIHLGPPSVDSFQSLLPDNVTIRLGQLEDSHVQSGLPASGIF